MALEKQIKVKVSSKPVHQLDTQIVVFFLCQDQSMFGELTEDVNKCLNGTALRLIEEGTINNAYGETVLIASGGKIPIPKILLLGLGESSLFTYEKLKELASTVSQILAKIHVYSFAAFLPSIDTSKYDYSRIVENFLEGIISNPSSVVHIPETTLTIVVEKAREEETILELTRIRSKFGDRITFMETARESEYY